MFRSAWVHGTGTLLPVVMQGSNGPAPHSAIGHALTWLVVQLPLIAALQRRW